MNLIVWSDAAQLAGNEHWPEARIRAFRRARGIPEEHAVATWRRNREIAAASARGVDRLRAEIDDLIRRARALRR